MNIWQHVHAVSTIAMVAIIWFVQWVHYPLFSEVGESSFVRYESAHVSRITWIVAPLMLAEVGSALMIFRPEPIHIVGLCLLAVIWLSTMFIQVPLHTALSEGFDASVHRRLVTSNWIRTIAWSLRLLLLWPLYFKLKSVALLE